MFEFSNNNFTPLDLGEHAKDAFSSYAKYVVQERALPDVRDGLKPVHRRILFAQHELGNTHNKPFKKSARIIGDVIGKYHPHGDSACYQSLVRMAQPWVMSAPLSVGQGNWGDTDKNSPAAMRYTEVRMSKISNGFMDDLKLDTVDWTNNYDNSELEPTVLPAKFPNLVINGVEGIAIGMASSLPPHHPVEAMNCILALAEGRKTDKTVSNNELMELMPAPDFPTGGIIHGLEDYSSVWDTGRGSVQLRAEWSEEIINGRKCIVVTALPYGVSPSAVLVQVNEARKPHPETGRILIAGVTAERDETDSGAKLRLVFECSHGSDPDIVFNELCNLPNSLLDIGVHYNLNVIKDLRPVSMGIRDALESFVDFRQEVIAKRTAKLLADAQKRMHVLEGLMKALNNIDETIATIRANPRATEAKVALIELLDIDEFQATKILEITLSRLTQGEISNYQDEHKKCALEVTEYKNILENKAALLDVLISETEEQIDVFLSEKSDDGIKLYDKRRSHWVVNKLKLSKEDLVPKEYCAIMLTDQGFVRRVASDGLKEQKRGTQGTQQIELAKKDHIVLSTESYSHDTLAFVTSLGRVAFTRAFELDTSMRGQHINNIIKLDETQNERVIKIQSISTDVIEEAEKHQLMIVTKNGMIKRTNFDAFSPRRNFTVRAIALIDKDEVVQFEICNESDIVTLITSANRVARYPISQVRETSRTSRGVKAVKLEDADVVISCSVTSAEQAEDTVLCMVSKMGQLKLSMLDGFRFASRGCKGVRGMKLDDEDSVLTGFCINKNELESTDIIYITRLGKINRVSAESFRVRSRLTMGVKLAKTAENDSLISAYSIKQSKEDTEN